MVLLTSSAVSVAISSGIVCIFTFLLFLSGYVLQQQTVKSLQEALQAPLEERIRPKPRVLPLAEEENTTSVTLATIEGEPPVQIPVIPDVLIGGPENFVQIVIAEDGVPNVEANEEQINAKEASPKDLWHEHIGFQPSEEHKLQPKGLQHASIADKAPSTYLHLAYVLSLPTTQSICSALLFTKWHRRFSKLVRPSLILLYPSEWETSISTTHIEAMTLLRGAEEEHSILLHPVSISKVWIGIDTESQLLSELARSPWNYDRLMYLKSPGIALDIATLDNVLEKSSPTTSWERLKRNGKMGRTSTQQSLHPDILLWAQGRGLMTPKKELKKLTASASTAYMNHNANEIELGIKTHEAAYVVFDEKELEHRRKERTAYGDLFERFERDRHTICLGTTLLS